MPDRETITVTSLAPPTFTAITLAEALAKNPDGLMEAFRYADAVGIPRGACRSALESLEMLKNEHFWRIHETREPSLRRILRSLEDFGTSTLSGFRILNGEPGVGKETYDIKLGDPAGLRLRAFLIKAGRLPRAEGWGLSLIPSPVSYSRHKNSGPGQEPGAASRLTPPLLRDWLGVGPQEVLKLLRVALHPY